MESFGSLERLYLQDEVRAAQMYGGIDRIMCPDKEQDTLELLRLVFSWVWRDRMVRYYAVDYLKIAKIQKSCKTLCRVLLVPGIPEKGHRVPVEQTGLGGVSYLRRLQLRY